MTGVQTCALPISELNVGALQAGPNRKSVVQGVALSVEEFEKLSKMKAAGIQVYVQPIPENAPVSLETIEKKLK